LPSGGVVRAPVPEEVGLRHIWREKAFVRYLVRAPVPEEVGLRPLQKNYKDIPQNVSERQFQKK